MKKNKVEYLTVNGDTYTTNNKIRKFILNDCYSINVDLTIQDVFAILHNVYMNIETCNDWSVHIDFTPWNWLTIQCDEKIEDDFLNMWKMYCREIKGYELKINMEAE